MAVFRKLNYIFKILFLFQIVQSELILNEVFLSKYSLVSTKVEKKSRVKRSVESSITFKIVLDLKQQEIVLKRRKSELLSKHFKILELEFRNSTSRNIEPNLYDGYVTSNEGISSVNGYVDKNYFYGSIIFNNRIYFIEEKENFKKHLGNDSENYNAILYNEDDMISPNLILDGKTQFSKRQFLNYYKDPRVLLAQYKNWKKKGKTCSLFAVVDYSFYSLRHKSNAHSAFSHILTTIEEANSIFRVADFDNDGIPDNVGFVLDKIILVKTKNDTNSLPLYSNTPIKSKSYLSDFAMFPRTKNYCLGIGFTAQKFENGVLGTSFTATSFSIGGICEGPILSPNGPAHSNSLVISITTKNGDFSPQAIFETTLAHELAHAFGAFHDNEQCENDHIMSPTTYLKFKRSFLEFSSCSKRDIIRTLVEKGECFEEVHKPFCGNGIIEEDEDCDCGVTADCLERDPCCTPRLSGLIPCVVNTYRGFDCHPAQGLCCTQGCAYADLKKYGLQCENFQQKCPCPDGSETCSCGLRGTCSAGLCTAIECARFSLTECSCPENNKFNSCVTCCSYEDKCVTSFEIAEMFENDKTKLVKEIPMPDDEYGSYGIFKFKGRYKTLFFREVRTGEYCVFKEKVGICSEKFQCVTNIKPGTVFPAMPRSLSGDIKILACFLLNLAAFVFLLIKS